MNYYSKIRELEGQKENLSETIQSIESKIMAFTTLYGGTIEVGGGILNENSQVKATLLP